MKKAKIEGISRVYVGGKPPHGLPVDHIFGAGWRTMIVYDRGRKYVRIMEMSTLRQARVSIADFDRFDFIIDQNPKRFRESAQRMKDRTALLDKCESPYPVMSVRKIVAGLRDQGCSMKRTRLKRTRLKRTRLKRTRLKRTRFRKAP